MVMILSSEFRISTTAPYSVVVLTSFRRARHQNHPMGSLDIPSEFLQI